MWLFFQNLKPGRRGSFFRVRNTNFVQMDKMVCSHPVVLYLQGWLYSFHCLCRSGLEDEQHPPEVRSTGAAVLIVAVVLWRVSWGLQMPVWYPERWQGLPLMSRCRGCPPSPSLVCGSWKLEFRPGPPACMPCVCPIWCVQHPLPSCLKLSSSRVSLPGLLQLETQPRAGSFLDFKHGVFSKIVQLWCLLLTQNLGCCFVSPWAAATWFFFFNYIYLNMCFVWDPVSYCLLLLWRRAKRRCLILRALYIKLSVKDRHRCIKQRWCL